MPIFDFIRHFILDLQSRSAAQTAATEACARLMPEEPIMGTVLFANEPSRYVIRVFCGQRELAAHPLPPWKYCNVFSVPKDGGPVELIHGENYRPAIR